MAADVDGGGGDARVDANGEREQARKVITDALWEFDEGAGWNMSVESREDYADQADAVLDALDNARLTVIDLGEPVSVEDLRAALQGAGNFTRCPWCITAENALRAATGDPEAVGSCALHRVPSGG